MKIELNEQELVDAVCLFTAEKTGEAVTQIRAELLYDENKGISAEAGSTVSRLTLPEQEVIDSAAAFLAAYHQFDPGRMTVELGFEEKNGIYAQILVH